MCSSSGYLCLPNLHSVTSFGVLKLASFLPRTWQRVQVRVLSRELPVVELPSHQSQSQAMCTGHSPGCGKKTPNREVCSSSQFQAQCILAARD